MFEDPFDGQADSAMSPATRCFGIVPSDSSELAHATKAIYIGTAGDVTLVSLDADGPVTFRNVAAGSILDVRVRAVRATATTAADIVGLA